MKSADRRFTELLGGNKQFVIPDFQRDYSWKPKAHCERLWNDVLRSGAARAGDVQHFLGAIVCMPAEDHAASFARSLVIDGQQRLTTLTLLLTAVRDHMTASPEIKVIDLSVEKINDYYLVNRHEQGDARYRLLLRRQDHEALSRIVDAKPHRTGSRSKAIEDAYTYFRKQLKGVDLAQVMRGINALGIVDITLHRGVDDPQAIFESLNAKGLSLSKSDLIRNCVLMELPEPEQTAVYRDYWRQIEDLFLRRERIFDNFARDYLDMRAGRVTQTRKDDIYPAFRTYWKERKDTVGVDGELGVMVRYARYYAAFRIGTDETPGPREERYMRIRQLRAAPAITVMRLVECRERSSDLEESEFLEALDLIESYLVRRAVCGLSTRGYDKVFAFLTSRLGTGAVRPLDELKVAFRDLATVSGIPSDDDFYKALRGENLYSRQVCRLVLERLENHGRKEPSDTKHCTIEHILPQSDPLRPEWVEMLGENWRQIQETYMHRLGNLTLTGYNAEYSDRSFQEKKNHEDGFAVSRLWLNTFVRAQSQWTKSEIEERSDELARRALTIWPHLNVPDSTVERVQFHDRRRKAEDRGIFSPPMDAGVREAVGTLRRAIREMGTDVVELPETRSISFHRDERYFVEIVPRKRRVLVLLRPELDTAGAGVPVDKRVADARIPGSMYRERSGTRFFVPGAANKEVVVAARDLIRRAYAAVG